MKNNYLKYEKMADILKAISHPMRLCILMGLKENPKVNVGYMKDCLSVPQSTLSQQLAILRRAGLVTAIRKAKNVEYQIANEKIEQLLNLLLNEGLIK